MKATAALTATALMALSAAGGFTVTSAERPSGHYVRGVSSLLQGADIVDNSAAGMRGGVALGEPDFAEAPARKLLDDDDDTGEGEGDDHDDIDDDEGEGNDDDDGDEGEWEGYDDDDAYEGEGEGEGEGDGAPKCGMWVENTRYKKGRFSAVLQLTRDECIQVCDEFPRCTAVEMLLDPECAARPEDPTKPQPACNPDDSSVGLNFGRCEIFVLPPPEVPDIFSEIGSATYLPCPA